MEKQNNIPEIVKGKIENIVFRNDVNDYTVLEISDSDNDLITAVGVLPSSNEGELVTLYGSWTYHKDFGRQFAFNSYEKSLPKETDGILQYLSSRTVKGVGPVTALKIVNRFGSDTFDVIENHPEWLADVPGITMKKAAAISESFREQNGIRGIMMFCKDYMTTAEVTRVYKKLGSGALDAVKTNPYILCNSDFGISFQAADKMALSLGHKHDSTERILSGAEYVLRFNAATNGHTCLPIEKMISATALTLSISEERINDMIFSFIDDGALSHFKVDDTVFVMLNEVAEGEELVARKINELTRTSEAFSAVNITSMVQKVENSLGYEFAKKQREAIYESLMGGVMILTGGPGTGKTTVIKALISIYKSIGLKVVLAAPTGRAAMRMSEATSEEAKTIHRMLEMERTQEGSINFGKNAKNPLTENVVIIDEASMIDLELVTALFRSLRRGTRLILIGDSDQLPSVGAGNVIADLIGCGQVKTIRLTEIFRQAKESLIVTNAHKINMGESPILSSTSGNFFFVKREEKDIPETVASLITERLPKTYGQGIRDRIQIITPSKKGYGGVEALNKILQDRLNPPLRFKTEKVAHGTVFREGDKVMQTANNYEIEWEKNGITGTGIFNGDIGIIEDIDLSDEVMRIRFDDRVASYSFDLLDEVELAYSITVHKSQGSEYPVVIIPMYSCAPMLMTRNLFYTAVTRARSMVILVGRADIPRKMVDNKREIFRYTTLAERIREYAQNI